MCGIAGVTRLNVTRSMPDADLASVICAMTRPLAHRGPDDSGIWIDPQGWDCARPPAARDRRPVGGGHQPMVSADGRYVITYNGEVYNCRRAARRAGGQGPRFRGHSDTEVILEALAAWGVERASSGSIGMFAFALWDRRDRRCTLARDRLGIKPLYCGRGGRARSCSARSSRRCGRTRLARRDRPRRARGYLRLRLRPGAAHDLPGRPQAGAGLPSDLDAPRRAAADHALLGPAPRSRARRPGRTSTGRRRGDDRPARRRCCATRCGRRMIADVPLGAFLSGGIDSSTVVALMQAQSDAAGPHLLHRLPRAALTTRRPTPRRSRASRHRPHRALRRRRARRCDVIPRLPECTTSRSPTPRRSRPICSPA